MNMKPALLILAILMAATASAGDWSLSGGSTVWQTLDGAEDKAAVLEAAYDVAGWEAAAGHISDQDGVGDYWYASGQKRAAHDFGPVEVFAGLGLAVRSHSEHVDYLLPSAVNFSLSGGVTVGSFRVTLRHLSNAGFRDPNRGQTWVIVGWLFGRDRQLSGANDQ